LVHEFIVAVDRGAPDLVVLSVGGHDVASTERELNAEEERCRRER
jgi:hypothetical protein